MSQRNINRRTLLLGAAGLAFSTAFLGGCSSPQSDGKSAVSGSSDDTAGNTTESATTSASTSTSYSSKPATVYFTRDISSAGFVAVYNALGFTPTGNVAVKLSTGEPGGHNFLQPELIADLVQGVNGTIVECNTAYGGQRSSTASHLKAAEDHGFTAIANVDIMDADGTASLPVTGGTHLDEDIVGSHFLNYDTCISLAHFKGHAMAGFGGAMKNCSIGIAAPEGKALIHSGGTSRTQIFGGNQDAFLESMAEAVSAVAALKAGQMAYVNVMNNLSVDCDCDAHPAEPTMEDIGILASLDPVALDRACVDLVYDAPDGQDLINRIESRDGLHIFDHAVAIGLGTTNYDLIEI